MTAGVPAHEPAWLELDDIVDAHGRQLRVFGGAPGLRDRGALESALARPINKHRYESADYPDLAAAYAFGLVRNHPFVDGNKRIGFMAMMGFLALNGIPFAPDPDDATAAMLSLAASAMGEDELARWIRNRIAS